MAVSRTQSRHTEETLDELSNTFKQLEIDEDPGLSRITTLQGEFLPHSMTTMNDNTLSQTFTGVGYKPIHVKMYVRSVEKIAEHVGKDKQDIEELCQLTFYNGLRGEARQWFDGLTLETQEDWTLLKNEFKEKFGIADTDKQQCLYFYAQVKALQQGSKSIPDYIQEGETLATLALDKDMAFLVAQAFVDRLNNYEHKQILDLVLLDDFYTFQEVKMAVWKLHSRLSGIIPAFAYPAVATSI